MRTWIVTVLLLYASAASAARFAGYLDGAGKVTIRGASIDTSGTWTGKWRCRGRACPVKRGTVEWACLLDTLIIGAVGGPQGALDFHGACDRGEGLAEGRWVRSDGGGVLWFHRVR